MNCAVPELAVFIAVPIAKLIVHKVDRPNMVGVCGPQPDDGAVSMIKPFALLVSGWVFRFCRYGGSE